MSRLLFPSDLPLPTFLCPSSAGVSCFSFPSFFGCVVCLCCVLFREAALPLPGWLFHCRWKVSHPLVRQPG